MDHDTDIDTADPTDPSPPRSNKESLQVATIAHALKLNTKRDAIIVGGAIEGHPLESIMSFRPVNRPSSQALVSDNNASVSASSFAVHQPLVPSHNHLSQERAIVNNNNTTTGSYPLQKQMSSNSDSQATAVSSSSTESNRVFTPPIIERSASNGAASSGQNSSQGSQLLTLSQLAAAREKMPDAGAGAGARSVKRTADGAVKDARISPTGSPPRPSSHSRNTSGVSLASTASSRATEVSNAGNSLA